MQRTIKTGFATLVLMLSISCTKENTIITSPGSKQASATQLAAVNNENFTINAVRIGK